MVSVIHEQVFDDRHPWLSIVIPVYNAEKYLPRCIDSIICQTFKNIEIIIVDDGSVDSSRDICLQYAKADQRVHYYYQQNYGSFKARLLGTCKAKGEYITFCDADDYYVNCRVFSKLYDSLSEHNFLVCQFGYQKKYNHFKKKSNTVSKELVVNDCDIWTHEYPKLICSYWEESHLTTNVWNKVYHRSLIDSLPDYQSASRAFWGDDLVMNLYLLENAKSILFLPDILYVYRQGSGGTSSFSIESIKDLDFIKYHQIRFLKDRKDKERLESILYAELASWFLLWVKKAKKRMDDNTLRKWIREILQYPSFVSASDYYKEHVHESWDATDLLRNADPEEYIRQAEQRTSKEKGSIKQGFYMLLKKI